MTAPIDTTFVSGTTITSDWLNGVNDHVNGLETFVHESSLISFEPFGTGAITRPTQDKMREFISVKDFGAVGDGVADDTAAIQNAINAAMSRNGVVHFNGPATYLITAPLIVKVTRNLELPGPDGAQFSDNCAAELLGFGSPVIKASGAMAQMMELTYDTSDSDIGPFYTRIEGIGFDGSDTALIGVYSNYSMSVTYERNRFWNLPVGISYTGYGGFTAISNRFKCNSAFSMLSGGGDSLILGNDFYTVANSTSLIVFLYYSGNCSVTANTFTNEGGYTSCYAIKMDATTAPASQEIRNVVISDNEFCGYTTGIYAVGKGGGILNVYDCIVRGNHTLPYGGSNPGRLLEAIDCSGFVITENKCNSISYSVATETSGISLTRTENFIVGKNLFENYNNAALRLTDCVRTTINDNNFFDAGKLGGGYEVVRVSGAASSRNYFVNNRFYQSSDSYAENGIVEVASANATFALENVFLGVNRPFTTIGAISVMKNEEYGTAAPTGGYWNRGDVVWNTTPSAAGTPGWICVTAGAPGTWKAMANLAA